MSYKELWYDWMGANDVLFFGINSIRGETYDKVMKTISWLGEQERFPYYLIAIGIWILLSVAHRMLFSKLGVRYYLSSWLGIIIMLVLGFAVNIVLAEKLKDTFHMPRPQVVYAKPKVLDTTQDFKKLENKYVIKVYSLADMRVLETLPPQTYYRGLPTSHVAFTILMVVALWPALGNGMALLGVLSVLLMGWSRIAMGVNFPADVVVTIFIFAPFLMVFRAVLYAVLFRVFKIKC